MNRISSSFEPLRARIDGLLAKDGSKLRRSLTMPLPASRKQKTNDQLKSNLFKLPYEIRITIYQIVIDAWGWGDRIHIIKSSQLEPLPGVWYRQSFDHDGDGLICIPCRAPPEDGDPAKMGLDPNYIWPDRHMQCRNRDSRRVKSDLNMFLLCRRIYSEAIGLLYSSFAFDIHLPEAYHFLSATPRPRLNQIKRLHVIWPVHIVTYLVGHGTRKDTTQSPIKCQRGESQWLHMCEILRSMKGLKELRVRLFRSGLEDLWESKLLESLVGILVQEGKFVVELPVVDKQEPVDRSVRHIFKNNPRFVIQRRTREGDRSNGFIAPSYDPDPLLWQQAVIIIIRNPVAVLKSIYSELALKVEKKIKALK